MPLAPFASRPASGEDPSRARLAVLLASLGIAAAVLAYAISPGVRHAVRHAARSVGHAVTHVFRGSQRRAAPALPTAILTGRPATLADLRGHPALITFWAAHCLLCAREAHAVARFAAAPGNAGRIVGVDVGDAAARGRAFLRHHHWRFTNLLDASATTARRYGVKDPRALPVTYVLDARGRIAATLRGPLTAARVDAGLRSAR